MERSKFILKVALVLWIVSLSAQAQTNGRYSYNKSRIYQSENTWLDHVEYDNGLGEVCQQIDLGITPRKKDLVTLTEYDDHRRVEKVWLPAAMSTNGEFMKYPADIRKASIELNSNDSHPYTAYTYEASNKGRVKTEQPPGGDWATSAKDKKYDYKNCIASGVSDVLYFVDFMGCLMRYPTYREGLSCKETIDEDGHICREYFDSDNQKLLTRRVSGNKTLSTYYIYDVNGDLTCVIPPKLVGHLSTVNYQIFEDDDAFKAFAYRYKYDNKRRCIYKKLPGCEPIYYVYDRMGNCVLTQDGELREKGEWKFSIPDKFGRVTLEGTCKMQQDSIRSLLAKVTLMATKTGKGNDATFGYAIEGITLAGMKVLSAKFYDDYTFIGKYGISDSLSYSAQDCRFGQRYADAKGLLTGCANALLGEKNGYLFSAIYYDDKGQTVQTISTNHMGGTDRNRFGYTYTGNVSIHMRQHKGMSSLDETYTYTYDHAGRLFETNHQVGNNARVNLATNTYDELGCLSSVRHHDNDELTTDYTYNVRSWLKSIRTKNLFSETLYYNELAGYNAPCYNGTISAMEWNADSKLRGYNFMYDGFSRLTYANYCEDYIVNSHYSTSYTYDDMENILTLKRNGLQDGKTYGPIDNLTYKYVGNQVVKIDDKVEAPTYKGVFNFVDGANLNIEYEYDKNGNLVKDSNKKISKIEYNLLNLPTKVTFLSDQSISYLYDAAGTKLRATYRLAPKQIVTNTIDYCGNMIYEDGTLKQVLFDGGYITFIGTTPKYHYYLKDHLGNNRMVVDARGLVKQINHYYPYGGIMGESTNESTQRYKYNGKEFDRMHGLDWYDYGARNYDAAIGRWFNVDMLAEKEPSISPYAYCMDNPIIAYDPNGMETHVISNANGTYTVIGGVLNKDRNIYVYTKDKNGKYIKGKSIGITTSTTSFYNSDEGKWERATIDPSDTSGRDFLNKMVSTNITLDDYMDKARNNHPYDFKVTNGGKNVISTSMEYKYRGMIIGGKGIPLYSSARDIGNIAAGIVAAKNGIPWSAARIAFDSYQSRTSLQVEGISTRNAEYYGWFQMYSHSNGGYEAANMGASIKSFFSKMYNSILNMF